MIATIETHDYSLPVPSVHLGSHDTEKPGLLVSLALRATLRAFNALRAFVPHPRE